jgi:DNA repair protein RadC
LRQIAAVRPEELARKPGVGPAKAAAIVAAFRLARRISEPSLEAYELRGPSDIAAAVRPILADARRERLVVLVCDAANRLRRREVVAEGAVDRSPLPVREVLNTVLRHDGRAFAVAHNHPSGEPEPSLEDRRATSALMEAATAVGLRFLDHVVVAGEKWTTATPSRRRPD